MRFYTRQRRLPTVIIVSLIDILAILLIFVIVTTTFRRDQPEVVIKLPEAKSAVAVPNASEPMLLTISDKEEMFLEKKAVTLDTLKGALEELLAVSPQRQLAINADTKAPFGLVIKVLDVLKESGVKNVPALMEKK